MQQLVRNQKDNGWAAPDAYLIPDASSRAAHSVIPITSLWQSRVIFEWDNELRGYGRPALCLEIWDCRF